MPRVLLIDDTPEIAELLTFALRDHRYDVIATGFTVSVNELIAEHQCGRARARLFVFRHERIAVRHGCAAIPAHGELPIVIISDTPEKADASLRNRQATRVMLIPKPFSGSHVARALGELLNPQLPDNPITR